MLKSYSGSILILSILYQSEGKREEIWRIVASKTINVCIATGNAQTKTIKIGDSFTRGYFGNVERSRKTKEKDVDEDKSEEEKEWGISWGIWVKIQDQSPWWVILHYL